MALASDAAALRCGTRPLHRSGSAGRGMTMAVKSNSASASGGPNARAARRMEPTVLKQCSGLVWAATQGRPLEPRRLRLSTRSPIKSTQSASRRSRRLPPRACGVIGIFRQLANLMDPGGENYCAFDLYEGLMMLQHRGQDSAGIVTLDPELEKFYEHKGNGLVREVFNRTRLQQLRGNVGIGHVRYPTAGSMSVQEAQPFFVNSPLGIYLIHNGNLTNTMTLRNALRSQTEFSYQRHLQTSSDSEVLLNVFADEIHRAHKQSPSSRPSDFVFTAASKVMSLAKGAYSVITLVDQVGLFAFRDPFGIRPLALGHRETAMGNEWCFASEDIAFPPLGFTKVRDVLPGEAILIDQQGLMKAKQLVPGKLTPCIFEYIYLSRPDSVLSGIAVYNFQLSLGRRLAKRIKETGWEVDAIVPVPDGSRPAATEMAAELGVPYREGLVKNRYVGRTFIMPDQKTREHAVRRKLNAMDVVFKDQCILLVDDSIVRGTTMRQIVSMCRKSGAKKVYIASASPPVRYPNVYGVDLPSKREMVANEVTDDKVCEVLSADGIIYQTIEDLLDVAFELNSEITSFEASIFTGQYITGDINPKYLNSLEAKGRGRGRDLASVNGSQNRLLSPRL